MIDVKIILIQDLLRQVSSDSGRNWVNVSLDLGSMSHGEIKYGIDFKLEMGTIEFYSLDEAIAKIKDVVALIKKRGDDEANRSGPRAG